MACAADRLAALTGATDLLSVGRDGALLIDGHAVHRLLRRYGSPLYVASEQTLRMNCRRITAAFERAWPGETSVLYAAKANNGLALRAILAKEGTGGECFGPGELYATLIAGTDPRRVVVNGSNKSDAELHTAVTVGATINIDAEDEIERLRLICRTACRKANVKLRLKVSPPTLDRIVPDYFGGGGRLSRYLDSEKWGFSPLTAITLARKLCGATELDFLGFSAHVGRISADPELFRLWLVALGRAVQRVSAAVGIKPRTIGIGGGWPREREPESCNLAINSVPIEAYAEEACAALREGLGGLGDPAPRLEIEPGRYIVGNAVVLLTTVGAVKHDRGRTWVNVDASTNNLMRIDTNGCRYHVLPGAQLRAPLAGKVSVEGLTCIDSVLAEDVAMPLLRRGDPVAILDAGMYAETTSTQFNGIPRPATVLVNGRRAEVIKERETVRDVFAKHRIPRRLWPRATPVVAQSLIG